MGKLYIYILPVMVGIIALLTTPIADTIVVKYSLIVAVVVLGIFGLISLEKRSEVSEIRNEKLLKVIADFEKESKQLNHDAEVRRVEAINKFEANARQSMLDGIAILENKLVDLNKENLLKVNEASLMLQKGSKEIFEEIVTLNQSMDTAIGLIVKEVTFSNLIKDELISLQNALPEELNLVKDEITMNQQDQLASIRQVEEYLELIEPLKDLLEEQQASAVSNRNEVVDKIISEFTNTSKFFNTGTEKIAKQIKQSIEKSDVQIERNTDVINNVSRMAEELGKSNTISMDTVSKQMDELQEINRTLVEGISQLADSKSVERKQLLKIQKSLINEFSK